jgi:hypothetical protein
VNRKQNTQRNRLLGLLRSRVGEWVPLWQIVELRICQYGARIHALRREGFEIENRTKRSEQDGTLLSWYRLVPTITEKQLARLWTIAGAEGVGVEEVRAIIRKRGFESTRKITPEKYEEIVAAILAAKNRKEAAQPDPR